MWRKRRSPETSMVVSSLMVKCSQTLPLSNVFGGLSPPKSQVISQWELRLRRCSTIWISAPTSSRCSRTPIWIRLDLSRSWGLTHNVSICLFGLVQAECKKLVTLKLEEKDDKKMHCKSGWYTERAMKETLKFSKSWPNTCLFFPVYPTQFQGLVFSRSEIQDVVAYTDGKLALRRPGAYVSTATLFNQLTMYGS